MRSRRIAPAAGLGLALASFALLTMGGGRHPDFGDPLPGLTGDQLARFRAGKAAFVAAEDVPGGLGPVFNDTACANCHSQAPPAAATTAWRPGTAR